MNTNSNSYTVIYASVMVIIVAFVLAFISASLQDRQQSNVELDKKKQILSALNINTKGQDAEALYNQYVKADQILNASGEVVSEQGGFEIEVKAELAKDLQARQLPLYVCEVEGATKYVLPLYGAGLWGAIWGYIALDEDKDTVYGVYFSHESETPGLGAEIATRWFQDYFKGKHVMKNGTVALGVEKNGKVTDPQYQVDGISGGTITSVGVDEMLKRCISQYEQFLTKK
ncbi:MAG: Na(+)-translocating NADH-quinone reductase subunit C [Bacteroides sp.]|nr:Na(+)-translocating NADH-quinone reductase subunit C [Bacteroides sp.]